ncbi:MAG: hypothetical protein ACRCYF_01950, partial [Shewanella sp.]
TFVEPVLSCWFYYHMADACFFPFFPDAQLFRFGGFLGVEIFFVLSGFLIGSIIIEKSSKSDSR